MFHDVASPVVRNTRVSFVYSTTSLLMLDARTVIIGML